MQSSLAGKCGDNSVFIDNAGSKNCSESSSKEVSVEIDTIIKELLDFKNSKPSSKSFHAPQQCIIGILKVVSQIFIEEQVLLELSAPLKVCGDIHGQYYDLLRIFEYGGYPPSANYLFLGDYVDRGNQGIETILLLFCYKIKYPKNMFLLRGNHETSSISRVYGFYNECKRKYSVKLWKAFIDCFNCLPVSALIDERILCMHGGLSPSMTRVEDVNTILRPTDVPDEGLICDILWADPDNEAECWGVSQRGVSYVFGSDVVSKFLKDNDLDLICRAHQVVEDGYEFCHKKRVITVFSAPNYCGEFENCGAFMMIEESLRCSFFILKPASRTGGLTHSRPKNMTNPGLEAQ